MEERRIRNSVSPGPFLSEATFLDGQLHGTWTIRDANGENVIQWNFDHNVRDGKATWWHPNGQKRLEATYKHGSLDGEMVEWDLGGKMIGQYTFVEGRRLVKTVGWYALGQKRFEGCYLQVPNLPEPTYDWWTATIKSTDVMPAGPDQKHGVWTEWYLSGSKKGEGRYDHDLPVGKFAYWYENGQKQAEGAYLAGVKSGTWITWHSNGLKESQGDYKDGVLGKWMHWESSGRLVETQDMDKSRPQGQSGVDKGTAQRSASTSQSR